VNTTDGAFMPNLFFLRPPMPRRRRAALSACAAVAALITVHCVKNATEPTPAQRVFVPTFSATSAEVRDFIAAGKGGGKAKLVYIDRTRSSEELCYVDFSEAGSAPVIHVIAAAKNPEVPVISPDGNWVVYASGTGTEAGSTKGSTSSAYLVKMEEAAQPVLIAADSACEPRFVQHPAGKMAIVYPTQCPDLAWEGHGRTLEVEVDLSSGTPVPGTPKALFSEGGYTGGLSWDGRYACGGGAHVAMLDLLSGKSRPDTLSYKLIQSCNASISSSRVRTNTMMYLNIEGSSPAINGGKKWGEWQTILISDNAKNLVKGYALPAAYKTPLETDPPSFSATRWHHCEWSNHPYFATATLNVDRFFKSAAVSTSSSGFDNTGFQERVYLLNLKDSTYLEVLRPDAVKSPSGIAGDAGFFWPWLWVEVPDGFAENPDWLSTAL
jgi:hypothetical protein